MTRDEKRAALRAFIFDDGSLPVINNPPDLAEALHSMSKLGLWPDAVDSVSEAQAALCWKLINRLQGNKLPDDLKM